MVNLKQTPFSSLLSSLGSAPEGSFPSCTDSFEASSGTELASWPSQMDAFERSVSSESGKEQSKAKSEAIAAPLLSCAPPVKVDLPDFSFNVRKSPAETTKSEEANFKSPFMNEDHKNSFFAEAKDSLLWEGLAVVGGAAGV